MLIGTYILYPIRILYRHSILPSHERCSRPFFRIPAAFDPATLLYPVLIPVFVTCLLIPSNEAMLLPNLILSISSIPRAILPIHDWSLGQSSFQWALSSLPLVLSSKVCHTPQKNDLGCLTTLPSSFAAEYVVLLYPLHQALLPTLGYLTTTSLLPAELQLLSISMINLLLFSRSPQSTILQALLWIGGLATFVSCGYVLRWGVALARIPSWRFRHPRLRSRDAYVLLSAIDDCFHRRLSKWISASIESESLGRDQDVNHVGIASAASEGPTDELWFRIANDALDGSLPNQNLHINDLSRDQLFLRRSTRRHTLPASSTPPFLGLIDEDSKQHPKRRSARRKHGQFNYLTNAQARVLKWVFAGYIYSAVLVIVAFPVRTYVRQQALNGNEPVGWAIGYLLGNLPTFRQSILHWALDDWIVLPEPYDRLDCGAWISNLSHCVRGSANIRLLICLYCLCVIAVGIATVLGLSESVEVDTRRKVFHGMMVVMFSPSIFIDPPFVALAFVLTLAIFLLLDLFRASQLPPLSAPLTMFLAPYVDGRDYRGPVVVSHMFLLIGCAIPLWLSLAGTEMVGEAPWEGWDVASRDLGMISGVICVGMGDAAASLIGRRYGRRRWCWSGGKSLEGSFAFAMAVVIGLSLGRVWLLLGGWDGDSGDPWSLTLAKASLAAVGASLTEAVLTGGNDNVVVPVILWILVRGLKI